MVTKRFNKFEMDGIDISGWQGLEKEKEDGKFIKDNSFVCPECESTHVTLQGRCVVCSECGWSSCIL